MRFHHSGKFLFIAIFIIFIGLKTVTLSGVWHLSVLNAYQFLLVRIYSLDLFVQRISEAIVLSESIQEIKNNANY